MSNLQERSPLAAALVVERSRNYIEWTTGSMDDAYTTMFRKGRAVLKGIGIADTGNDLKMLAYMLHADLSKEWHRRGDLEQDYLVVGDLSDQVTDDEALLLNQIEPELQRRRPSEGIGSMSPEVTALHDLLLEVAAYLSERWAEDDDAQANAELNEPWN